MDIARLPEHQLRIIEKAYHPSGVFEEFKREEIEQSIPDKFEQIVREYSDRLALKTDSIEFTYDELNRASNQIARAITERQGTDGEPIPVLMEQGATLVASILGILKAGKAYVPLDPRYPRARLTYMQDDLQAGLLVTNAKHLVLAGKVSPGSCELLNTDALDKSLPTENLGLPISSDALASILYTSGTTGQPKGVMQTHRNILHLIMAYTNDQHICVNDRLSLLASCSFGGSVFALFGALLNGASLFPLDLMEEGVARLAKWLNQQEITFFHVVPAVYRSFVATLSGREEFPYLRLVQLGGDRVDGKDVDLYKKHFSHDCTFCIGLGATEVNGFRFYFADKKTEIASDNVPAGYAVEDKEVLLLDDSGREVGFKCVGEITIKSRHVSPGYWRATDLTEAKFLPDPQGGDERTYLTGDLGFMNPDGCLFHMGRKDFQVKVRGHRIELAEVEAALASLPGVEQSAAIVTADKSGENRLVGYYVPAQDIDLNASDIRLSLEAKLPEYMMPSVFVEMKALPQTPSGKIDRGALPEPGGQRPELASEYVAPKTPVEASLVEIWRETLGIESVGVHDDFRDLGGNSLMAGQVLSRVIQKFQVEIPLRSLMEAPTVAEMALLITENRARDMDPTKLERMLQELENLREEETD
jgi:amino acid adenylation domain-containing protein